MARLILINKSMNEELSRMHEAEAAKEAKERKLADLLELSIEVSERKEAFPFSGLDPEEYAKIKATDEEYPGFSTPVDEMIAKFEEQGMRLALSTFDSQKGNAYIIPGDMEPTQKNIEDWGLKPENFEITNDMDESLKKLIEVAKDYKKLKF